MNKIKDMVMMVPIVLNSIIERVAISFIMAARYVGTQILLTTQKRFIPFANKLKTKISEDGIYYQGNFIFKWESSLPDDSQSWILYRDRGNNIKMQYVDINDILVGTAILPQGKPKSRLNVDQTSNLRTSHEQPNPQFNHAIYRQAMKEAEELEEYLWKQYIGRYPVEFHSVEELQKNMKPLPTPKPKKVVKKKATKKKVVKKKSNKKK